MNVPEHWNEEIRRVVAGSKRLATTHKPDAVIGVAVDDGAKRDHFVPQLQAVLNDNEWARHLTFRVVPMNGDDIAVLTRKAVEAPHGD